MLSHPQVTLSEHNSFKSDIDREQKRDCSQLASFADALWARHAIFLPRRLRDEPKECLLWRLARSLISLLQIVELFDIQKYKMGGTAWVAVGLLSTRSGQVEAEVAYLV